MLETGSLRAFECTRKSELSNQCFSSGDAAMQPGWHDVPAGAPPPVSCFFLGVLALSSLFITFLAGLMGGLVLSHCFSSVLPSVGDWCYPTCFSPICLPLGTGAIPHVSLLSCLLLGTVLPHVSSWSYPFWGFDSFLRVADPGLACAPVC